MDLHLEGTYIHLHVYLDGYIGDDRQVDNRQNLLQLIPCGGFSAAVYS